MTLADRIFESRRAESELETQLEELGVPYEYIGWDDYDCSLELKGVANDYRLTKEAWSAIKAAGFAKVYVNHLDKWETHYTFSDSKEFDDGWRVSYPHKRKDGTANILVEKHIPNWPQEWFETGDVKIQKKERE